MSEPAPVELPDADDIREGIEAAEAEEAERERWLASPEAVRQREASRYAYTGLPAAESEQLFLDVFSEQLRRLNADPARWLSDAAIVDPIDDSAAAVRKEGDTSLLDATMPLRAVDEDGELRKVDLTLEATPGGFEPANPLVELSLPDEAHEPVTVGEGERSLVVTPLGVEDGRGAQLLGDKSALYPDALGAEADTDQILAPTSTGVEIFELLRSTNSPEVFRFELDLPEGAELLPDETGGARVLRDGVQLASIPFPYAVDAQGTTHEVELEIEGDTVALHIPHHEAEVAYPLLLDPAIVNDYYNYNWFNGHNLDFLINGTWTYEESHSWIEGFTSCQYSCFGPSGRALYISMMGGSHQPNEYGQWVFRARNSTTYLAGAWANPFQRDDHGCGNYSQPHDYVGMWHNNAWNGGVRTNQAKIYGYHDLNTWGSAMIVGLGTGSGNTAPCRRDLALGGAAIWEDDWQHPSIDSISSFPSGWIDADDQVPITVQARDEGLGIHTVTLSPKGRPTQERKHGCSGVAGSRCPNNWLAAFNLHSDHFDEGIKIVEISAMDPTGKVSSTEIRQTKVDRSNPVVTLDGQLAEATEDDLGEEQGDEKVERLRLPVYKLKVVATDGNPASGDSKDWRSGVKDIRVFLEGKEKEVPWSAKECPGPKFSCAMEATYELELVGLDAGMHRLKVDVEDQVGNTRERKIEFEYFPATGMKDEYVMHYFPLPDGLGNEAEEEHPVRPELAVNVMNGNLVYRERDFEVPGAAVDLELERFYNSQLPESEDTEWGDGWTLAETPALDPEEAQGPPSEAEILDSSGGLAPDIELPTKAGEEEFDPELQATITKEPDGGYELTDETGESATSVAFNEDGRAEALRTESFAKVDYEYEAGQLSEIEVQDPATFAADPKELEIDDGLIEKPTYVGTFGAKGSGDGQLNKPADVAVDSVGNLWVADKLNNRIQKFGPDGKFLAKFGSLGSGNGQLSGPSALAIDSQGNIWVADGGNRRVQKFNAKGEFLLKFGSQGTGNGQFSSYGPRGIAIDPQGNVWVSDYSGRIQKFSLSGQFLLAAGSQGSGNGQFGESAGLDVGPDGKVWVGDWTNNRVSVFSEAGVWLFSFGVSGSGDGQFSHPDTVEVDREGNVYVGDQSNSRVQLFNPEAKFIAKFGSAGSGDGQFSFAYPLGIETDGKGHLWVADVNNNRVQEWLVPIKSPVYGSSFGVSGSGDGQLNKPADVAVDFVGDLWVVDKLNNRIQKFASDGKFIAKVGSSGSGNGQFSGPAALAIDSQGNLWVADGGNRRVQKFNAKGKFLLKFGSQGTGNGQFSSYGPRGIAVDTEDNVWVSDYSGRIQQFDAEGKFIQAVGSSGSGNGQFGESAGLDVGGGKVWVGDWTNNRVSVFSEAGAWLFSFGVSGSGDGQFSHPDAVEVDRGGNVYVGDQSNNRVQQFSPEGKYIRKFGTSGSGAGQFNFTYPLGVETDAKGNLWVADVNNHRVQHWLTANYEPVQAPPIELSDGDPAVDVESEGGLVASVEGNAAGEHSYEHEGGALVAHDGPEGETTYEYDGAGRMTKVMLPNSTWGEIEYFPDGRVESVTVDPADEELAKTTRFDYSDEPRRTFVEIPGAPDITYDIGPDGSVVKSWNAAQPPEIEVLSGTLYAEREKHGISPGTYNLEVFGYSPEGVSSIQFITDGNVIVDEIICEKSAEECEKLKNEWVAETGSHAPGILNIEVIVTDQDGKTESARFWVDIPVTPPEPPGALTPPKFKEVRQFREDYGLEVVFPVADEFELNDRIFDLIGAWHNPHTPAGEVARASWERWGVPLRPADVAELEYREAYVAQAATAIPQWSDSHASSTYAGHYVDHRAGGILHVGFTQNQSSSVEQLKAKAGLMAPDRVEPFPYQPTRSLQALQSLRGSMAEATGLPGSPPQMFSIELDVKNNRVQVGTAEVSQTAGFIDQVLGPEAGVSAIYQAAAADQFSGRYHARLPFLAGMELHSVEAQCTAGFGAWSRVGAKPNGDSLRRRYVLTAGHCYKGSLENAGSVFFRSRSLEGSESEPIGRVERQGFLGNPDRVDTDALAIALDGPDLVPRWVYECCGGKSAMQPRKPIFPGMGQIVCQSSRKLDKVTCGPVTETETLRRFRDVKTGLLSGWHWLIRANVGGEGGDSGAPVWMRDNGRAVGLVAGGGADGLLVTPFERPPGVSGGQTAGISTDPKLSPPHRPLHLQIGG